MQMASSRHDPLRPCMHFVPPAGWMNDPNGVICVDGIHHLFYQYNPYSALWYRIHWGHATSRDLVHWEHQPIALYPDTPGLDEAGCWSGCAVLHDDQIWLFYTAATGDVTEDSIESGYYNQAVALVRGTRAGTDWKKLPTPLIERDSFPVDVIAVRDPIVFRDGEIWRMTLGAGIQSKGGAVLLYRSDDLLHWDCEGILFEGTPGEAWECPQLLTFDGERAALLVNIWQPGKRNYSAYFGGTYRDGKFNADFFSRLDMEDSAVFAPQAARDPLERWVLWGWLLEERGIPSRVAAGWSGTMALPRIVTMGEDGRLRMNPPPELDALRTPGTHDVHMNGATFAAKGSAAWGISNMKDQPYEIIAEVVVGNSAQFSIRLNSQDIDEWVSIDYNQALGMAWINRAHSNHVHSEDIDRRPLKAPLSIEPDGVLKVRVFVDRSTLEVFWNDGEVCAATRIYPTQPDLLEIGWHLVDGQANMRRFEIHALQPIRMEGAERVLPDAERRP